MIDPVGRRSNHNGDDGGCSDRQISQCAVYWFPCRYTFLEWSSPKQSLRPTGSVSLMAHIRGEGWTIVGYCDAIGKVKANLSGVR